MQAYKNYLNKGELDNDVALLVGKAAFNEFYDQANLDLSKWIQQKGNESRRFTRRKGHILSLTPLLYQQLNVDPGCEPATRL